MPKPKVQPVSVASRPTISIWRRSRMSAAFSNNRCLAPGGVFHQAGNALAAASTARLASSRLEAGPASSREDAKRAVEAAARAFPAWWKTPPGAKQRLLLKAADILERRQMEIVGLLATETGCTFGFGMFQTMFTPNLLRQAAGLVYQPI